MPFAADSGARTHVLSFVRGGKVPSAASPQKVGHFSPRNHYTYTPGTRLSASAVRSFRNREIPCKRRASSPRPLPDFPRRPGQISAPHWLTMRGDNSKTPLHSSFVPQSDPGHYHSSFRAVPGLQRRSPLAPFSFLQIPVPGSECHLSHLRTWQSLFVHMQPVSSSQQSCILPSQIPELMQHKNSRHSIFSTSGTQKQNTVQQTT